MQLLTVGELRKKLKSIPSKTTVMFPLFDKEHSIYTYVGDVVYDKDAGEVFLQGIEKR